MPDECCRTCGWFLKNHLKCPHCNFLFQDVCNNCNGKSLPKFHDCKQEYGFNSSSM